MARAGLLLLTLVLFRVSGEEWTRFRGFNGSGIGKGTGYPIEFSKDRNLLWRAVVRPGKSSPVLTDKYVFLTGSEDEKLFTQCYDRASGKLLWERMEPRPRKENVNRLNTPAAITPVTDGKNVYAFFKEFGLVSYDASGRLRWKVPLGPFTNSMGMGASPILAGDSVVILADQIGESYIAAFSTKDGKLRWRTAREESDGWSTPLLYEPPSTKVPVIVTASGRQIGGHRITDGVRQFTHAGLAAAVIASPVMDKDTVIAFGYGYESAIPFEGVLARSDKNKDGVISPDEFPTGTDVFTAVGKYLGNKDGIVTKDEWDAWSRHVGSGTNLVAVRVAGTEDGRPRELWRYEKGFTGVIPSPLLYDDLVYVIKNGGIITAFDKATGEVVKVGRVRDALGGYSASPVAADGRIFIASEEGKISVVRPGRDWEVIAVNDLGEGVFATPALSNSQVFVRTAQALYCFGNVASK